MATAAQIAANQRNSRKSSGPRTEEGKNISRLNALDHSCRASILVLPTEDFGEYESKCQAWKLSLQPRNPAEEFLVNRLVKLAWQSDRIDRAHTARLNRRICFTMIEEADQEQEQVIELGQKLFQDACGPVALHLQHKTSELCPDGETSFRISDYADNEDQPVRLVHRLQTTITGCDWLLKQWTGLRNLLEQGISWLAPDKLKAVRLLGRHPIDAFDSTDVARVYLASHLLRNQEGDPFQDILDNLAPDEVPVYEEFLKLRNYSALAPHDSSAARQMLLDIIDRASAAVQDKAGLLREVAEIDARSAAHRLSWDDTPEGERLRRYEQTCNRAWSRMLDLLLKIRSTRGELDIATIASIDRSVQCRDIEEFDELAITGTNVIAVPGEPAEEPTLLNEANSVPENAPNEPNSRVQAPTKERPDAPKEFRIDTPHARSKPSAVGVTAKESTHPVIQRVLGGRKPTLMNLSPIFGEQ